MTNNECELTLTLAFAVRYDKFGLTNQEAGRFEPLRRKVNSGFVLTNGPNYLYNEDKHALSILETRSFEG